METISWEAHCEAKRTSQVEIIETEHSSGCGRLTTQTSTRHGEEVAIEDKANIDHGNEDGEDVAHVCGLAVVLLGNFQSWGWHNLLPSQAHVCAEDDNSCQVEETPAKRLKDFKLHSVDVSHVHGLAAWIIHPKEVQPQLQQGLQVQQVWRWTELVWLSGTKAEPEQQRMTSRKQAKQSKKRTKRTSTNITMRAVAAVVRFQALSTSGNMI